MFLAYQLVCKVLREIEKNDGASNKFRFPVDGLENDSKLDAEKVVADLKKMELLDPAVFDVSAVQHDGSLWVVRISWEKAAQGTPSHLDPNVLQALRERAQNMFMPA
ncbi:hypothetical protein EXS57_02790 [Candidatus Kaiserbacteria bacterium]|nr:hypothetical protein [Candidatus Kaiserbacteria bacterium]